MGERDDDRRRAQDYVPPDPHEMRATDASWFVAPPRDWRHPVTGRKGWLPDQGLLTFGQYVKRSRYFAQLTQVALAEASGVEQGSISRLERGLAPAMKVERLVRLSTAMGRNFPLGYCPHEHWCPWRPAPRELEPQPEDPDEVRAALRVMYGLASAGEIALDDEADD